MLTLSQDVAVLTDPNIGALRLGLPHVFLSADLNYVPDSQRNSVPSTTKLTKKYHIEDINAIYAEYQEVKEAFGEGAATEWKKGLAKKGADRMADAARFETWEDRELKLRASSQAQAAQREYNISLMSSQPGTMQQGRSNGVSAAQTTAVGTGEPISSYPPSSAALLCTGSYCLLPGNDVSSVHDVTAASLRNTTQAVTAHILTLPAGGNTLPQPAYPQYNGYGYYPPYGPDFANAYGHMQPYGYPTAYGYPGTQAPPAYGIPPQQGYQYPAPLGYQPPGYEGYQQQSAQPPAQQTNQYGNPWRAERDIQGIQEHLKAEIERRCMELSPPILPRVLPYMDAYNRVMLQMRPFTEQDWQNLKPQLLEQRYDAEEKATFEQQQREAALQASIPSANQHNPYARPVRDATRDQAYEAGQKPLRSKLSKYAEDYISQCPLNDKHGVPQINANNAAAFATNALVFIHQKFIEANVNANANQNGSTDEKLLSLDNMKWVFDHNIRPYTEAHRKELFECAECEVESYASPKPFAFEGLIQHFGAKHTGSFSKESVVVHWQTAEWPEDPPFKVIPFPQEEPRRDNHSQNNSHSHNQNHNQRGNGRSRNTPRGSRDGPYDRPRSSTNLAQNEYFSSQPANGHPPTNGQSHTVPQYNGYAFTDQTPHNPAHGFPQQVQPVMDMSTTAQITEFTTVAKQIWDTFEDVQGMIPAIRIQTTLAVAVARFKNHFHQMPNLDLVTDALASYPELLPLKSATGLACSICTHSKTDSATRASVDFATRLQDARTYNFASLITHFKINHLANDSRLDWSTSMIDVPEARTIRSLMQVPHMNDEKLALVDKAFPGVFSQPLPVIGEVPDRPTSDSEFASRLYDRVTRPTGQGRRKKGRGRNASTPARDGSEELPEAREDEYDPRRPAFINEPRFDPARFDTDLARPAPINLAPETLAALQNLTAFTANQQQRERSPSVGVPEPRPPAVASAPAPAAVPDIGAILASLQQQQQQQQQQSQHVFYVDENGNRVYPVAEWR
jgi:hypothetical protein